MAIRFTALFILLYAIADVSVLQVYCGNEALGIPPEHHITDLGHHLDRPNEAPCDANDADCHQIPDDHDYDHQHQCFCWQNVVLAFVSFDLGLATELAEANPPVFFENLHSNSALSHLFRPPRTA